MCPNASVIEVIPYASGGRGSGSVNVYTVSFLSVRVNPPTAPSRASRTGPAADVYVPFAFRPNATCDPSGYVTTSVAVDSRRTGLPRRHLHVQPHDQPAPNAPDMRGSWLL